MSRGLGLALAALAVALLAIAFLLGRESQRMPVPVAAPIATASAAPMVTLPDATTAPTEMLPAATVAPVISLAPAATFAPIGPGGSAPVARDDPQRAEVARYFAEIDAIQAEAKVSGGDPEAAARAMLQKAVEGDTAGMDALLASNRRLAERLRAVAAPPACDEHRRKTVEAVEQGVALLEAVKKTIQGGAMDPAELTALTTSGQDLERRGKEVDALAAGIKQRYGL